MVVRLPPMLNDDSCFLHRREFFAVQTLVAQPSVEALDVPVLPWTAWLNKARTNVDGSQKVTDATRDELGAVVAPNELGNASDREQIRQGLDKVSSREFAANLQGDAFSCVFIDDYEHLQRTTIDRSVEDEINRPDVVFVLGLAASDTAFRGTKTPSFHGLFRHFQAFLSPETIDAFRVHTPSLASKQTRDLSVSEARKLGNEFEDPRKQSRFVFLHRWLISLGTQRLIQCSTSPTLRHLAGLLDMIDCLAPPCRAQ